MDLSINRCYFVRHFQISSTHVNAATFNCRYLDLSNQLKSNRLVVKPYKPKSSTRFTNRISDDLVVLELAKLFKVISQLTFAHGIVKASNKHLVPNRRIPLSIQFRQLLVVSILAKLVASMHSIFHVKGSTGTFAVINMLLMLLYRRLILFTNLLTAISELSIAAGTSRTSTGHGSTTATRPSVTAAISVFSISGV